MKIGTQELLIVLAIAILIFGPTQIPKLDIALEKLAEMTYQETAYEVMKLYLTDFTEEELKACIFKAYDDKFDTKEIAPLRQADDAYYLELFHGATIAFKDMALSILPHLLTTAARKNHVTNEIVISPQPQGIPARRPFPVSQMQMARVSLFLSQKRRKPHPGKADGDAKGRQYLCSGNHRQF